MDGIVSELVSLKGKVAKVVVCGKTVESYVVSNGHGSYSHGATVAEARRGLLYKLSSRDTTEFKGWKLDKVVPLGDAIKAYRAITGACEGGTRGFCEGKTLPQKLTIKDAISLTKGQYGSEAFAGFFGGGK